MSHATAAGRPVRLRHHPDDITASFEKSDEYSVCELGSAPEHDPHRPAASRCNFLNLLSSILRLIGDKRSMYRVPST